MQTSLTAFLGPGARNDLPLIWLLGNQLNTVITFLLEWTGNRLVTIHVICIYTYICFCVQANNVYSLCFEYMVRRKKKILRHSTQDGNSSAVDGALRPAGLLHPCIDDSVIVPSFEGSPKIFQLVRQWRKSNWLTNYANLWDEKEPITNSNMEFLCTREPRNCLSALSNN